jgi:hypothetical protein
LEVLVAAVGGPNLVGVVVLQLDAYVAKPWSNRLF